MLQNIDRKKLAEALIRDGYEKYGMESALSSAQDMIDDTHILLEPAVQAFIDNVEIPDIEFGDFSLHQVREKLRKQYNKPDYNRAKSIIDFFNGYIHSPEDYDENLDLIDSEWYLTAEGGPPYFVDIPMERWDEYD